MSTKRCVNSKGCATCEYWGGQRTVDRNPKWVEIPTSSEKGICQGPGPYRSKEMSNITSCRAYKTWRYLQ